MIKIKQLRQMSPQPRVAQPHSLVGTVALVRFARGLPTLCSVAMLLWSGAPRAIESAEHIDVVASATSPDGRFAARLGSMTFGGVSLEGMSFTIHKNGSNESLVVFELTGTNEGRVKWEGDSKVIVFVPVGSKINWHGTLIGYPEVYVTTLHPNSGAP
jgi:hypothetical protein